MKELTGETYSVMPNQWKILIDAQEHSTMAMSP